MLIISLKNSSPLHKSHGFTLIELMIVVAIIGILAAVAIPQYNTYILRSTISAETTAAMRPLKNAIDEYVAFNDSLPTDLDSLKDVNFFSSSGNPYTAVDFASGIINSISWSTNEMTITFNASPRTPEVLKNNTIIITATLNINGAVNYQATGGTVPAAYHPKL